MNPASTAVNSTIKQLTRILCRVDDTQLARVPLHGPLILVSNHVNFLDIPLLFTHLLPRPVTGFVKSETWDNPAMAMLFNFWQGIPIRRGEADLNALRQGIKALQEGKIVAIAPEGTRSNHGRLQKAHAGVVILAMESGAPLLPLVYYGGEKFHNNIRNLRRTDFYISVGRPFYIETGGIKANRQIRQQIADDIMYQLAALLPPDYRGYYSDICQASNSYFRFHPIPDVSTTKSPYQPQENQRDY